jgi:hypothetical protein
MGLLLGRRRPLLRAAAVGGIGAAAYRSGRRREAGAQREQEQDTQISQLAEGLASEQQRVPAPAAPAALSPTDRISALERLSSLRDQGVLEQDEFEAEKHKILQNG